MSQSPTSPTNQPPSVADTWSIMMEDNPGKGEEAADESEKDRRSERSEGGGGDEEGSPRKRRRTSTEPLTAANIVLQSRGGSAAGEASPTARNAPLQSPLEPLLPTIADLPPPSFVPYNPARRTPSTTIASLINPPSSDAEFRRPSDLESLVSASKGPISPDRSRATPSPALSSLFQSRATSYPPPPSATSDIPRHTSSSHLPVPVSPAPDVSPRPESRPGLVPWAADSGRSSIRPLSLSPIAPPEQSRQFLSTSVPGRTTPLSSDPPPPPRRGSAATDPVRADDRPLFFAMLDSPPLRERSLPPIRRAVSSGPSQPERRGSPSRNASRAWFSLGPMEAVDMRQWDQHQREAYQLGYTDALKAVQRGTMGVAGVQYPYPQLLRGDEALPAEEGYGDISSRRPSLTDLTRSFYPEASARAPIPSSSSSQPWLPHARPHPPRYPSSQFYEPPPPHHQSTSAWADDRRAEYARYEYTVPPPARHQSDGAHRSNTPGGPYYPAPHPRSYTFQDHPTYGSNPTTTTTTTTSPSQISRGGQRQLISCYPCRSRKMKCDGTKPCFQCVRRGGEAECEFAMTVRRRGKGKKASSSRSNKSQSGTDGEGDAGESGQESGDERWRMEGMNLPDVGEET